MDPLELRRKNFIPADGFPAELVHGMVYDSGNYQGSLDKLLTHVDVEAFRREQAELRERASTAASASPPTWRSAAWRRRACSARPSGLQGGYFESALVRVHPTGSVTAYTGTSPHGQGHETGFAQIVADRLGSRRTRSRSCTATPRPAPSARTPTARARWRSAARRSAGRPTRSSTRPADRRAQARGGAEDIELRDGKFSVRDRRTRP
jgi:carbon-monoxide dehydrogenase large subunit